MYKIHFWWLIFIIKLRHQLVFDISNNWTPELLFKHKTPIGSFITNFEALNIWRNSTSRIFEEHLKIIYSNHSFKPWNSTGINFQKAPKTSKSFKSSKLYKFKPLKLMTKSTQKHLNMKNIERTQKIWRIRRAKWKIRRC